MFLMRKKEIKKGFTLVELLAVIVILAIILITILSIINVVFSDVDETISEAEENVILSAAENYALEYRGTTGEHGSNNWNEEIEKTNDGEEVSFCVSLKSLIDYGYFKDDKSNFSKYKDNKAVYFKIKNGVIVDETFIDLKNDEDGKCKYYIKNSSFADGEKTSGSKEVNAGDGETPIGNFEYKVNELGNNRYSAYLDFELYMDKIFKQARPINVITILDATGSMSVGTGTNTDYGKARLAITSFSEELVVNEKINNFEEINKIIEQYYLDVDEKDFQGINEKLKEINENLNINKYTSKIALIEYGENAVLNRKLNFTKLSYDDFGKVNLGYTNVGAGIDMATSLIFNELNSRKKRESTYVILLYDGGPTSHSYCVYNNVNLYVDTLKKYLTNTNEYEIPTNEENYINIYYKNYMNGWVKNNILNCTEKNHTNETKAINQTIEASKYLNSLGIKFITLGYGYYGSNDLKEISTQDDNLCINVGTFESHSNDGKKYCYYKSNNTNITDLFTGLLDNIIYYNNALESAKLEFAPAKVEIDGEKKDSIILYDKNGQRVDGNKITEELNELGSLGEDDLFTFLNNYTFEISDALYDSKCNDVKVGDVCKINKVPLFSVSAKLKYMSRDESETIVLEVPKFNLTLTKNEKIN